MVNTVVRIATLFFKDVEGFTLISEPSKQHEDDVTNISPRVANMLWSSVFSHAIDPKLRTLLHFMTMQALGLPTGDHSYFNQYSFAMYQIEFVDIA